MRIKFFSLLVLVIGLTGCGDEGIKPMAFFNTYQKEAGEIAQALHNSGIIRVQTVPYEQALKAWYDPKDAILYADVINFIEKTGIVSVEVIRDINKKEALGISFSSLIEKKFQETNIHKIIYVYENSMLATISEIDSCSSLENSWFYCKSRVR